MKTILEVLSTRPDGTMDEANKNDPKTQRCARCQTTEGDFWTFYGVPLCRRCASIRRYIRARRSQTRTSFTL